MPLAITENDVRNVVGGSIQYEQLTNQAYKAGSNSDLFVAMAPAAIAAAEGILMIGFKEIARVRALIDTDANVKLNVARICAGIMGSTKLAMTDEKGNYPYRQIELLARKELEELARAQVQSPAQQDNPAVGRHDRTRSGNIKSGSLNPKMYVSDEPGVFGKGGF